MSKKPKSTWTLQKFFEKWYVDAAANNRSRKPACASTIQSRRIGVRYWTEIMATKKRPKGPKLCEITVDHLEHFKTELSNATFSRGQATRKLSSVTQYGRFQDIVILLAAAGPKNGSYLRANLLSEVPSLYVVKPTSFPKRTWTIEEAQAIAKGIDTFVPCDWNRSIDRYRDLARATMALWYYTGHRKSTIDLVGTDQLIEYRHGHWRIELERSVKTGKPDQIEVHPQLLTMLLRLGPGKPIIDWGIHPRTLFSHFKQWQAHAGLTAEQTFSPQAFRRLNAQVMVRLGVNQAQAAASNNLGHSSGAITAGHYADARSLMLLQMPDLFKLEPASMLAAA